MKNKLFLIFLAAFILRLSVIFLAHHGDLNNNISWGNLAIERGLVDFYGEAASPAYEGRGWPHSAPNQPPATILLFLITSFLYQFINNASWWLNNNLPVFPSPFIWFWETHGTDLLVKLPSVIADLVLGWVIFNFLRQEKRKALFATCIWLFNPAIIYNSTVWGQTDGIVNLLGLLGVLGLLVKDLQKFSFWMTVSLLFKGSLAIFIPILIFVALWQKHSLKIWIRALAITLITIICVSIWFHPRLDLFFWLINLYQTRILPGEVGFLTANAFNFWWLVDPGRVLDSAVYYGLPARVWGFIITLTGIMLVAINLRKSWNNRNVFLALSTIALISFLFMTRIHERYLYPFFPYATILLGFERTWLTPYVLLSAVYMINMYHLFWAPSFAPLENLYLAPGFMQALSFINLGLLAWWLRLGKSR